MLLVAEHVVGEGVFFHHQRIGCAQNIPGDALELTVGCFRGYDVLCRSLGRVGAFVQQST